MNLVKKLIVGTSLGVLLGAGHIALSDENIVSKETRHKIGVYLASLAGSSLGVGIAYSKPVDRLGNRIKRAALDAALGNSRNYTGS